ncbi:3-carboxy-cis,cis-muconate cycloisomerase [Acuticoccus sediminis]|uniref:3-carboxy-cis,cis-muconate cycloisomerase n=1 Tax=Acuticoccus sediminis TaxID=2184697 RepID=UPI001CFC67F1|nr:3-carboxy-cis,cis-muconate cycloisomerase [Acuticoccus sediminis]
MSISVFQDPLLKGLFGDPLVADAFDAERTIQRYNQVEIALTRGAEAVGLVPTAAADAIAQMLDGFVPDMADLAAGTVRDGIPLPRYAAQIKAAAGDNARYVHLGSTSQDIMDTALALTLMEINNAFDQRLVEILAKLSALAQAHGQRSMMGRTRMQAALSITVADRLREWSLPLERQRERLVRLRPRIELVQFGGPVGTRRGWNGHGNEIATHMAGSLGLSDPGAAWHTARDGLGVYVGWLTQISAALGKIGEDVFLMAQQGIGEIRLAGGGSSSAMAHKKNPIDGELLVTLARFNAAQLGGFAQSLMHEQERSGVSWALEWMILPQMCAATGASLLTGLRLLSAIEQMGAPEGTALDGAT